jgi:hypothetical protein
MIAYHGTPCGGQREQVQKFLAGRHALIPFLRPEDIATAADVCQSFCIDNSAYTAWKQDVKIDWDDYYRFCETWCKHPAFDWAIIPDLIDESESMNDCLIDCWPFELRSIGVPVWHMNESLERFQRLCSDWLRVAIGSSGEYAKVGDAKWWKRIGEAMAAICDEHGRPRTKLHGLRMLDQKIFRRLPLASADSTNAVRNANLVKRFGIYPSPNLSTRMASIAERIEAFQSAAIWSGVVEDEFTLFA